MPTRFSAKLARDHVICLYNLQSGVLVPTDTLIREYIDRYINQRAATAREINVSDVVTRFPVRRLSCRYPRKKNA